MPDPNDDSDSPPPAADAQSSPEPDPVVAAPIIKGESDIFRGSRFPDDNLVTLVPPDDDGDGDEGG